MRPLLDTNVLLDVGLGRPGLHEASGAVIAWCLNHPDTAALAVHSLATVYYLMGQASGGERTRGFIADLVRGMEIAPMDNAGVLRAVDLPMEDFEDALIAAAAMSAAATHIVTRNLQDFRKSPVKAVSPEQFMRLVAKI